MPVGKGKMGLNFLYIMLQNTRLKRMTFRFITFWQSYISKSTSETQFFFCYRSHGRKTELENSAATPATADKW